MIPRFFFNRCSLSNTDRGSVIRQPFLPTPSSIPLVVFLLACTFTASPAPASGMPPCCDDACHCVFTEPHCCGRLFSVRSRYTVSAARTPACTCAWPLIAVYRYRGGFFSLAHASIHTHLCASFCLSPYLTRGLSQHARYLRACGVFST